MGTTQISDNVIALPEVKDEANHRSVAEAYQDFYDQPIPAELSDAMVIYDTGK